MPRKYSKTCSTAGVARITVWLCGRSFENDSNDAVANWVWH